MTRLVAVGKTDVGKVRTSNEDAYLVGDSVFAVADGMGGHAAGEVAASAALEPVRALDGRVFADAPSAAAALRDAVITANQTVSQMAEDDPSYHGMGTTLTATLLEGTRLHIAHVGDSRAYLLRDGQFSQITDDHTLVQHLIDEGQITVEEAATHPQRSIITRAIGVSPEVDVDSMSLELQPGDVLLLCSDGLTGVVDDHAIAQIIAQNGDPDTAVRDLLARANAAGSPDNVTAVLLHYDDAHTARSGRTTVAIRTRHEDSEADWAERMGTFGAFGANRAVSTHASRGDDPSLTRLVMRWTAILFGIALLVVVLIAGGRFLLNQSYFVGLEGEEVVIYQGIDMEIGPVDLARVRERTGITLDDVPPWYHPTLEAGRPAADINDARRIVRQMPQREDEDTS